MFVPYSLYSKRINLCLNHAGPQDFLNDKRESQAKLNGPTKMGTQKYLYWFQVQVLCIIFYTFYFGGGRRKLREREKGITQTRPFNPTAISNDIFFPSASRTGHVGELNSLKIVNIILLICHKEMGDTTCIQVKQRLSAYRSYNYSDRYSFEIYKQLSLINYISCTIRLCRTEQSKNITTHIRARPVDVSNM
jgi:hypothetical protein